MEKYCDSWTDCFNGVDEARCFISSMYVFTHRRPPALVDPGTMNDKATGFVNAGIFVFTSLNGTTCPDTHFQCPDNGYCLPVYLRCNGILDCPFHQDEAECESYTCPGFFRCRDTTVCLHPSHVCDGHSHCPQHDDELLCDMVCPDGCLCYGWAFFCSQPFHVALFPELRFLDAHETPLSLPDINNNPLLVFLNLSSCNIETMGNVREVFVNLLTLDISNNVLKAIPGMAIAQMPKLRLIIMSDNPLTHLFDSKVEKLPELRILHLCNVPLTKLNTSHLSEVFPNLHSLNISNSDITRLLDDGFQPLQQLRTVDLRGCYITHFSDLVFQGLGNLKAVYAESFKMCCPALLPKDFNVHQCQAPMNELSSCEDLLGSAMYTTCVFVFSLLSVMGNFTSFLYRTIFNKSKSRMGFSVLVTHLSVADFVMGLYLAIIGCTDRLYQGVYLWHDHGWRHSSTCRLAGFLSLLSSEVSALLICLITLDRFLVLRFPFSQLHFGVKSAHLVAVVVWMLGLVLAGIPLIKSHWQFYSQTGICIPLPITRTEFPGRLYSFAVIIIFNFILFLFVSFGQLVIYWSIRANSMSVTNSRKKNKELTIARRLISVAMSNFLCWFPIGLLGIMASRGQPISKDINVGIAVLVLPLNSALNPFQYTVNVFMERRQRSMEEKLRKMIASQLQLPKTVDSSINQ